MREVALVSSKRGRAGEAPAAAAAPRYWAFLSYSHKDSAEADWLHKALENYRVPRSLVGREAPCGMVPASFAPVFRDRQELAASGDLGHTIREALAASRCLIVLCSPEAAASRWANEEITAFKKLHPNGCILAVIVAGEPFASEMPGREAEECFPPALRHKFDARGRPTSRRAEPIAADLRANGDGRQLGLLKLVAGMLGVGLDDLVQRDQQRRHKRLTMIAAASLTGMVLTSGLAVFAFDKRDEARDQRREAEGLVGFMLGDLRQKLEPIGRLDTLDAVGARALQYFEKQDKSELSDAALAQRSRALTLMGEIASARGDLDGALARYDEAMAGTGEMVRRYPGDPQRLFDHAQNVFWVGDIAVKRGQHARAEAAMREYQQLAYRMVAIDPDNPKWQLEKKYSDSNLGAMLYEQRRYPEAIRQLTAAVATGETIAAREPGNREFQKSLNESLAWLADAQFGAGLLDEAIAKRERQIAQLETLQRRHPADVDHRQRLIPARRALGRWLVSRGEYQAGLAMAKSAVRTAEQLIPTEPDNAVWLEYAAGSHLDLAKILLVGGQAGEAATHVRAGCDLAERVVARDSTSAPGRLLTIDCLRLRATAAAAAGASDQALALANLALAKAKSGPTDSIDGRLTLARTYTLLGDIALKAGDRQGAQRAWQQGLATWPRQAAAKPNEMAILAGLYRALGRTAEAEALDKRLRAMGYQQLV